MSNQPARPTVLVTGGAGYIGSHAVLALLDSGWRVVVIDNLTTGFEWAVPEGATLVRGDIADQALVARLIAERGIGAIMHFRRIDRGPESVEKPLKYYENNTVKSRSLIEARWTAGCATSSFLDRGDLRHSDDVPIREEARTQPINPYGWSKLMTERMLADAAFAHPLNYCALRYFNVAGADPQGRSGQSTAGATHLIKVAVEAATGKRSHVSSTAPITKRRTAPGIPRLHPRQRPRRRPCRRAREADRDSGGSYVMNCGYSRGFSVREVLDAVDRVTKHDHRAADGAAPRRRSRCAGRDNSRILATCPGCPSGAELDNHRTRMRFAWERKC
jgi:UDP-glucose 4-epimerase